MIRYDLLEPKADALCTAFKTAKPYSHLVLDNFCDETALRAVIAEMPDPAAGDIARSRDYVFAKEKYEKSSFKEAGPRSKELYDELMSDRFQALLRRMTGEEVFVDPDFHGGGFHQGGKGSFLDMHADFNFHPLKPEWFRNLNVLLYLNDGWEPEHKGSLKMRHLETGEADEVGPQFNRCVIMHTRDYTLHGYDPINFPEGSYRRSVAAYAYNLTEATGESRSVTWYPEKGGVLKQGLGRAWPALVAIKSKFLGSGTARNR